MGSPYSDQRAASAWKQRQEYWVTQDNSPEWHHREWAEGLEKHPQGSSNREVIPIQECEYGKS